MGIQQVRPRAETRVQLDNAGLAQCVDGWIGNLGEALAEIVVDRAWRARERRNGRVVAHGPDGVLTIDRHRLQDHTNVFARVVEEPLQCEQPLGRQTALPSFRVGKGKVGDERLVFHFAVEASKYLAGVQDLIAFQVDYQHLAWTETSAFENRLGIEIDQTGLGAGDHQSIACDEVTAGPQTVAIERSADEMTVSEGEGGGAVPWLDTIGVVVHELGDLFKFGRRHEHADCLAYVASVAGQQLAAKQVSPFDGIILERQII